MTDSEFTFDDIDEDKKKDYNDHIKISEIKLKLQEANLKKQEAEYKKQDTYSKYLENLRYHQETEHQKKLNEQIEASFKLKNIETKINIINNIGLKLDADTDKVFGIMNKLSESDEIDSLLLEKIKNEKDNYKSIYI